MSADATRHSIHFLAYTKCCDILADRFDRSCKIEPEYRRRWVSCMWRFASANLEIERIHTTGVNAYEDLVR
jgi:hypothetical protein